MFDRSSGLTTRFRSGWALAARVLALAALSIAPSPQSADAGVGWCRSDPVVVIDDRGADVFVGVRFEDVTLVKGRTEIVITTARGVSTTLATPGAGYGHGERVRFAVSRSLAMTEEGIELEIKVRVPAREPIPVQLEFAPHGDGLLTPDSARGKANGWIVLRSVL